MRIGFDAFPAVNSLGGVGSYARYLLRALLELDVRDEDEIVAYVPSQTNRESRIRDLEGFANFRLRRTGKNLMRWCGGIDGLDLYHGTNFKTQTRGRSGAVVTIHDLWLDRFPEYSKKLFGQKWSFYRTRRRALLAEHVITVSQYSAQDIQELFGVPENRISVIWNGVSKEYWPDKTDESRGGLSSRFAIQPPYILFVGGADPRKNHQTLFRAYAKADSLHKTHVLVAIGNPVHKMGTIVGTSEMLGIRDRIISLQGLSVGDMRSLYSHAELFVFPSWYEGFGFPVLEAMACGVPVITSKGTALQEVAGQAALLVDPGNEEELSQAMVTVIQDQELQRSMREKGLVRAKEFTWERAARQTWDVYREVCQ